MSTARRFAAFELYALGSQLGDHELYSITESESQGKVPKPLRHVNFSYLSSGGDEITVTNQPAAQLRDVSRCETPRSASGMPGDVVLGANSACEYGEEILLPLGTGVLRADRPTVEIQLGQRVVFVHASNREKALEGAQRLVPVN